MAWLLKERASGREWRVGDSDVAWEAGGYDSTRFELHVLDEDVVGTPDGVPGGRGADSTVHDSQTVAGSSARGLQLFS
ncbi:hypothetical protein [Amycolatopsis sp. cmx-4-83]|uniref:hypothetical protein n=1 Tax=Amycolatopsis sp. cmx-4-83 TaxID=2790940 RepID=UPI00397B9B38